VQSASASFAVKIFVILNGQRYLRGRFYFFCEKKVQKAPGTLCERPPDPSALLLYVGATVRARRVSAPAASAAVPSRGIHSPERVSIHRGPHGTCPVGNRYGSTFSARKRCKKRREPCANGPRNPLRLCCTSAQQYAQGAQAPRRRVPPYRAGGFIPPSEY